MSFLVNKEILRRGMPGLIILLFLLAIFLVLIRELLIAGFTFLLLTMVIFYRDTRL